MKAFIVSAPGTPPRLADVDVAAPAEGEVVVDIAASGVCGSDGHVLAGTSPVAHYPLVLGHEGAGVVAEVGAGVSSFAVGDHVIVALYGPCFACENCLAGHLVHCNGPARVRAITGEMADGSTRLSLDGAPLHPFVGSGTLAEQVVVRASQLVRIAPDIPLDVACLAGCGVTTGLGAVFNVAEVKPGQTVAVVGCGGVGLSVVQGARIAGAARIIAFDTNPRKLDLAREVGATDTIQVTVESLVDLLRPIAPAGVDVAFEVVGRPELVAQALAMTRPGGIAVMVGSPPPNAVIPVDGRTLFQERQLRGTVGGSNVPGRDLERVIALYRSGQLLLEPLISERFALADAALAFEALAIGDVARSVVIMNPEGLPPIATGGRP
jgi:S-(hydroxymethyl)glutathione dehydrogenase / alcohol dehydrogenase